MLTVGSAFILNYFVRELLNFVAEPATQYVLSVRAFNNFGKGPVVYDLVYTKDKSGSFYDAPVMMQSENG